MPLVTVIIPNYNHEKFLKQRIDSVLNQTFQDFEIILIDDNSTDLSMEVLNRYASNPKVSHFIGNDINSGSPFKQWYEGLQLAKGKYLWIAETDDFAENSFLENTLNVMENSKNVVFTYTDSKIVDENGNYLMKWSDYKNNYFQTKKWSNSYTNKGFDEIIDFLLYKVTINNISSVLFNKFYFEKINFNELEKFKSAGDLYTYISLSLMGDIAYIPLPLNNYRRHNNASKVNFKNGLIFKERLDCFIFFLDFLDNNTINNNKLRLKKALYYFINKNGSNIFNFGYSLLLKKIIVKYKKSLIISHYQEINYTIVSCMHSIKILNFKKLSIKILKKSFAG